MEVHELEYRIRLFVKTVMGNAIPIAWLFVFQPLWGIRFDGIAFWSIYAVYTLILAIALGLAHRTTLVDFGKPEVPTPWWALIAATYPVIVFLGTYATYYALGFFGES